MRHTWSRWALLFCAVALAGCNCGKQPVLTKTESSLVLAEELLDFGPVTEGTNKSSRFRIENQGRSPVDITLKLVDGSSPDFVLGTLVTTVDALSFVEQPVTFTPTGGGEDVGSVEISTGNPDELPLTMNLHGGPIAAALEFDPDPLDFRPATMILETRTVKLKSVGGASLEVKNIGVSAQGNPDFSVVPTTTPRMLLPGEFMSVQVEYARSADLTDGLMEVNSNDADAGVRVLHLIPDRPAQCADSIDNDIDGLTDFPNDPGCDDAADDDESNSGACVSGAMRACGSGLCVGTQQCVNAMWDLCQADAGAAMAETCNNVDDDCDGQVDDNLSRTCYTAAIGTLNVGRCREGMQTCAAGSWGTTCPGEVTPATTDTCGNSIDDDCDGVTDEGCNDAGTGIDGGCNPTGLYSVDGGALIYSCCGGLVNLNISQFQMTNSPNPRVQPGPTHPGAMTSGAPPLSCGSSFDVSLTLPGGCTETYRLQGMYTGANTFVGTYSASFSGSDCTGLCAALGGDCLNQSWPVSAYK